MQSYSKPEGRWMDAVAVLAFLAMTVGGYAWLQSAGFFRFRSFFDMPSIGIFLFCALIVAFNIAIRIPALLRWLRAKLTD
jgi:hypothetical protein